MRTIVALLLLTLLPACSQDLNPVEPLNLPDVQPPAGPELPAPQEPGPPEPPGEQLFPMGTLEVAVEGNEVVFARGYRLVFQIGGEPEPRRTYGWQRMIRVRLPQGTHSARLESIAGDCVAETPGEQPFSILEGDTSRIAFQVSCAAVFKFAAGVYERVSYSAPTVAFHGTLTERVVIDGDGSFRLQFDSGKWGSFAYPGGLYLETAGPPDPLLVLVFSANSRKWTATATLRDNCLAVRYNMDMWLSDFEHGEYCRTQEGT